MHSVGSTSRRSQRGMISFAVLIFFVAVATVSMAMFLRNAASAVALQSFDAVRFQTIEKNGLAQLVEQSIMAARGTLVAPSSNSIATEISNRLSALNVSPGTTLTLASSQNVASHLFYPIAPAPALAAFPEYSIVPGSLVGKGLRLCPFLESQVYSYLGRSSFTFNRSLPSHPAENRLYTVNADLFSVPLTNIPVVAYGLPNTTGSVPSRAPQLPLTIPSNAARLTMTSNNPANDPTAVADLFSPTTPEQWPAQFGPAATWCWDAYEYVWSAGYQNLLLGAAGAPATYDFSSQSNPAILGVTTTSASVTVDLSSISATTLAFVDGSGTGHLNIVGSSSGGPTCLLYLKNNGATQTAVTIIGDNQRPVLIFVRNCSVTFSGNPSLRGALFLDRSTTATGAATLYGHLSFFAGAQLFPGWNLTVNGTTGYEASYAALAPRVLLVSARGVR